MRAAVLSSPREVRLLEVDPPEPGPDEVLVALDGAGICASELPLWEGRDWFCYPRAAGEPGHEGWGRIAQIGAGVSEFALGQRVALLSQRAHAEADLAAAAQVVPLPASIEASEPLPVEPLACAVNAISRAGIQSGQRVAVVGCGFLGLLLLQLCASTVGELAAISRRRGALELAEQMGATRTWLADDSALPREPQFDVVFEVTGHQQPLDLATTLTATRGRLVIVGYHQDGRRSVDMQLWNWRGLDVINAHERDPAVYVRGMHDALAALQAGVLDVGPLITHRFALDELEHAYEISCRRPEGFVKAVWCRG